MDTDRLFELLYSFSGLARRWVITLGIVLVSVIALIEWSFDLPLSDNILYALVVGAVTFHGSVGGGFVVSVVSAVGRALAQGAPRNGSASWLVGIGEGVALLALLLVLVVIVHALYRALDALQHEALHDPLTGILNQRGFREIAEQERRRALREETPLTMAYVDIDGLKELNDRSGHRAGNRLLLNFVTAARDSTRAYDTVGRVGGDEFVILLPGTDHSEAVGILGRLRRALAQKEPSPRVSIGVITYMLPTDDVETMLDDCDQLMYIGKRNGGDSLVGEVRSSRPSPERVVVDLRELVLET